jgi:hypothetical protein
MYCAGWSGTCQNFRDVTNLPYRFPHTVFVRILLYFLSSNPAGASFASWTESQVGLRSSISARSFEATAARTK